MMNEASVLEVRHLSKSFGAVQAVVDVSFEVGQGEVVGLVGDNAAGKSTVARAIAGVYQPTSGEILLDGTPVEISSTKQAFDLGIASVFQELALCENLDVTSNIFLGREVRGSGRLLDEKYMEISARSYLDQLGSRIPDVHAPLSSLSAGQRQCVAIARTLVAKPRLVVLDEPTASLSVAQTAEVLTHIQGLRELGLGTIFISHNLSDIKAVADRIVVLRHGRINGIFEARTSFEDVLAAITGAKRFAPVSELRP